LPKHCSIHGLRKSASRRMAESEVTAHEIMSITGHKTLSEVQRYTDAVDRERLAEQATRS
jgi:integrase